MNSRHSPLKYQLKTGLLRVTGLLLFGETQSSWVVLVQFRTDLKATKCGRLSSGIGEKVDKVILGLQVDSLSYELRQCDGHEIGSVRPKRLGLEKKIGSTQCLLV